MNYECGGLPPGGNNTIIRNINLNGITCDACYKAGMFQCPNQQTPCNINMQNINIWSAIGFECQFVNGTIGPNVFPTPCY